MKKLNLKLGGIKEMLTREQMKKVVGGDGYGYEDSGAPNCLSTYFYSSPRGCGYTKCRGYMANGQCDCQTTKTTDAPCGYA